MKYRKKPVVIEAVRWDGLNHAEIKEFCPLAIVKTNDAAWKTKAAAPVVTIIIPTLKGEMNASPGDFIIKGVNGEFYPCKPDIFAKSYEALDSDKSPDWILEIADCVEKIETKLNKTVEYKIQNPSKQGYPDISGLYYECDCGNDCIDIEQAEEWAHCPFCGKEIAIKETLLCGDCEYAQPYDEGSLCCENGKGKFFNEDVTDTPFNGCKHWKQKETEADR